MAIYLDRTSSRFMPPSDTHEALLNRHQTSILQQSSSNTSRPTKHMFDRIEQEEDKLRDARDDLLGSRYKLKTHRDEIQHLRQRTGVEEGSVINQLRAIFRERNIEFSVDLENAFERVLELRDNLGSLEGKYEEEEEKYDQLEWKYTQKESDFVINLTSQRNVHLDEERDVEMNPHALGPAENGTTPRGFSDLRPETIISPDFGNQSPLPITEALLQNLEQHAAFNPLDESRSLHFYVEHDHANQAAEPISSLQRSKSETAVSQAYIAWNKTRDRVNNWVLDTLSCSHHQKLILRSLFSQDNMDDNTWWESLTQHWTDDDWSAPPPGMNAGDSTYISREIVHPPVASTYARDELDTERPDIPISEEVPSCGSEDDGFVHMRNRSVTWGLKDQPELEGGHPQTEDLDIPIVATSLNIPSSTLNERQRSDSNSQLLTFIEKKNEVHKSNIPTTSSEVIIAIKFEDVKSKDNSILTPEKYGKKLFHRRRISNPETSRFIPLVYHHKHHDAPNTTSAHTHPNSEPGKHYTWAQFPLVKQMGNTANKSAKDTLAIPD